MLRLEYREPSEVAWLIGDDVGDLRRTCEAVAALAPIVAGRMTELEVMVYPPTTSYADRLANGPWFSASGPTPTSELVSTEQDDRSPTPESDQATTSEAGAAFSIAVGDKIQAPIPENARPEEQRVGVVTAINGDLVTFLAEGEYDMYYGPGDDDYCWGYPDLLECVVPLSTVTYHWPKDE